MICESALRETAGRRRTCCSDSGASFRDICLTAAPLAYRRGRPYRAASLPCPQPAISTETGCGSAMPMWRGWLCCANSCAPCLRCCKIKFVSADRFLRRRKKRASARRTRCAFPCALRTRRLAAFPAQKFYVPRSTTHRSLSPPERTHPWQARLFSSKRPQLALAPLLQRDATFCSWNVICCSNVILSP
jgi:hypothetical protein